jgi:hypothetical protein
MEGALGALEEGGDTLALRDGIAPVDWEAEVKMEV